MVASFVARARALASGMLLAAALVAAAAAQQAPAQPPPPSTDRAQQGGQGQGGQGTPAPEGTDGSDRSLDHPGPKKKDSDRRPPRKAKPDKPEGGQDLPPVEIHGHHDADMEQRRNSTAAKMVFGREELDRYGDTSIGEVLKRLPGITIYGRPGRGGDIRMRGLGHGYTQILINGDPAPRGFSFDTLAPEEVERIEIYRAPIAEHSARAIAGTINIVLREDYQRRQTEIRLVTTEEQGHEQPSVSIQRSDTEGSFGYNVALNVFGKNQSNELRTITTTNDLATGRLTLYQDELDQTRTHGEGVHLTSRLNWRLDGGDQFNLQPFLMQSRSPAPDVSTLVQTVGTTPPPFANADWVNETESTVARVGGDWQHNLGQGSKLRIRFLYGIADNDTSLQQDDFAADGALGHALFNSTSIQDRTISNGGKYSLPLRDHGEFSAGWDLETIHRSEGATTIQDGMLQLAQFGADIAADINRAALFAQRDWTIRPWWSAYAGLRWEGIETISEDSQATVHNDSSVVSPILQSLWRLGGKEDPLERPDQLRLALARTYRAPTLNNLVARPTLSTLYPVSGPNTPTSPDKIGNPELRPELAWGLDAAYEHYLSEGGILSVSAFHRLIEDLMRASTNLETVSWSPFERWVQETQNVGRAQTSGVELEAKFRMTEWYASAPPLDINSNYSRFWSTVSGIIGPNNRLDQQPKQTANLGLGYRLSTMPLTLGVNYNWTPAFLVQQADNQIYSQGLKRVLDCYGLWVFNPNTKLRVSLFNALHLDYDTGNSVLTDTTETTAEAVARTYLAVSMRLEMKL